MSNKSITIKLRNGTKINSKSYSNKHKIKKSLTNNVNNYSILNSFLNRRIKFIRNKDNNFNYNKINVISPKIKEIFNKDELPYIPSKERQKGETNFIRLIKSLMDTSQNKNKKNIKNDNYINTKTIIEDPYKPKGYNYYKYSREHPGLINDSKGYIKIVQELSKKDDKKENKNNERCLSYNNGYDNQFNEITLNNLKKVNTIKLNDSLDNNIKPIPISKSYSRYANTNGNNLLHSNLDNTIKISRIIKNESSNNMDINQDSRINTIKSLPIISPRELKNINKIKINENFRNLRKIDYNRSDIFNLKNEDFLNVKRNGKNIFKINCIPSNNYIDKKTSINEVGWSPKLNTKSRISVSSVSFNILCPNFKNISPTKKDIDIINNNNSFKSNLMSEFVDMCKPGDSELRKEYQDKLNANKNIFHRKNYCSSLYDLHHEYKDLILDVF